jgi:hypothetical protein
MKHLSHISHILRKYTKKVVNNKHWSNWLKQSFATLIDIIPEATINISRSLKQMICVSCHIVDWGRTFYIYKHNDPLPVHGFIHLIKWINTYNNKLYYLLMLRSELTFIRTYVIIHTSIMFFFWLYMYILFSLMIIVRTRKSRCRFLSLLPSYHICTTIIKQTKSQENNIYL